MQDLVFGNVSTLFHAQKNDPPLLWTLLLLEAKLHKMFKNLFITIPVASDTSAQCRFSIATYNKIILTLSQRLGLNWSRRSWSPTHWAS